MRSKILLTGGIVFLLLAVALIGAMGVHSFRVATVTVTLLEGQKEPKDLALPFAPEAAPDYRLLLHYDRLWVDCGTFQNTPMGSGLTWNVPESAPPASFLIEYKLVEKDRALDDVLEQLSAMEERVTGNSYAFQKTIAFSTRAGWAWFVGHPLGHFLGGVMALVIFLLIAAAFSSVWV